VLVVAGLAAAALAIWVTLRAGFLAYPGWLAAQKADFILGPIAVGLYWHHKRPDNRFGLMLIVLGLLGGLYILESSADVGLFRLGIEAEDPIWIWTTVLILAFPSGRLEGLPERLVVALNIGVAVVVSAIYWPPSAPGFTISGCRVACPGNGGETSFPQEWLLRHHVLASLGPAVAVATIGVIAWRFATGTAPRRRALAIGTPIALLYLFSFVAYRGLFIFAPGGLSPRWYSVQQALQWLLAVTPSLVWYGFLFALIAAELYAGRVLRTLVGGAVKHPSFGDLEGMLRGPLGDPGLRLGFRSAAGEWYAADEAELTPRPGQKVTLFELDSGPAVEMIHDAQLADEPELLETAGEIVLLALENAELEAAQKQSLRALADSRARLVNASDRERRRLERDLHDGAQQRLTAIQLRLRLAAEHVEDEHLAEQLEAISRDAEEAVDELRELSHGIYPTVLRSAGLGMALRALAMRATIPVRISDGGIGRISSSVEAAIYFCCTEAVQNAIKHAGEDATVAVRVVREPDGIHFTISDDGVGMPNSRSPEGDGLVGMRDRIGAVGGELEISSAPGGGTRVRGWVPAGRLSTRVGRA
jgi:signal transduction histidine kinase